MEGGGGLEARIPARLTAAEGRKFAFTVGAAFLVLAAIVVWRGHVTVATVFATLGATLGLAGVIVPGKLGPVYRGWMKFGLALSKVTTPIFMGIVYFGVLGPTGLIRRAMGKNAVLRPRGETYWVGRDLARKSDLQRQF
jgi:hypothetical protein